MRNPERLHVVDAARRLARVRKETLASFVVRAISREVLRCESEMSISERIAYQDEAEKELVKLLPAEVRKEYGL